MQYLPVFFDLRDRPVTVIGGGAVAMRKIRLLLACQARIRVLAPRLCADLAQRHHDGLIDFRPGEFSPTLLDDGDTPALVIAATDDEDVNAAVAAACRARRLPINVVDSPSLCDFIFPAIIDRSPLVMAVSSGGAAPVLARLVRSRIEAAVPAAFGQLAELAETLRPQVKAALPDVGSRRHFWEHALESADAELALQGDIDQARQAFLARLAAPGTPEKGEALLIAAGSGDPDDMTFRALRLLQRAELVFHDADVPAAIVDLARRDADRVALAAADEGAQVLAAVRAGRRVAWLRAGDGTRHDDMADRLAREGLRTLRAAGVAGHARAGL